MSGAGGHRHPGTGNHQPMAMTARSASAQAEATEKALEAFLAQLNRGSDQPLLQRMGDRPSRVPVIPTGVPSMDVALGVGGLPRGRIVEFYGAEMSGKTTLALATAASAQSLGLTVGYIDAEHALSVTHATNLGVDVSRLMVSQPDHGEQALDLLLEIVSSGLFGLVVVDSVSALVPRAELEGTMDDTQVGLQARMMSKALRKLTAPAASTGTTVLFINQLRTKIGVMYGNPDTTTGGRALPYYASVRVEMRASTHIKDRDTAVGQKVSATVRKNRMAPPYKKATWTMFFDERGLDPSGSLLEAAEAAGVVTRTGSYYRFTGPDGEITLGNGRDAAAVTLSEDPDLARMVSDRMWETLLGGPPETTWGAPPGT